MKILNKIPFVALLFTFAFATAQEHNMEVTKETIVKTYELERGNTTIPYEITIWNKEIDPIKLEKEDKYKLNQDRVDTQERITKVITIDDQVDNSFDNTIQISYLKDADKDFKMMPTDEGFVIMVKGEELRYSVENKDYEVKTINKNFFMIEQPSDSK
ncbi:hypothetical protein D1818_24920 [Aquimarina sp. BL5]|uniref:hypothetical protein n=1 Tax=Aquimarina sp. BL5 TaxID=1714860 RepID=UPI000E47A5C3|nr:hypothetical protein [Aquimarina sp. BL5]AXT53899.1 hypothetical protein D1818_24920 [Aquimarina sp. BL5]RKN00295.1 hypothetical protein D7036_19060 [Aquimarina sp. BL5]